MFDESSQVGPVAHCGYNGRVEAKMSVIHGAFWRKNALVPPSCVDEYSGTRIK